MQCYNPSNDYFSYYYHCLVSSDDIVDLAQIDTVIDNIADNMNAYGNDGIQHILDGYNKMIERHKQHIFIIGGYREKNILNNLTSVERLKDGVLKFYGNGNSFFLYDQFKKEVVG